ncbi:MAG: hypothetical protein CMJ83_18420 [Planctomycetes bacterium]|nr:hypothetical protein [Planctomycetota bacterium]
MRPKVSFALVLAAVLGLLLVGLRVVASERAVAERAARGRLQTRVRETAKRLSTAAGGLLGRAEARDGAGIIAPDGHVLEPPEPVAFTSLRPLPGRDPEGDFYLQAAERALHVENDAPRARELWRVASKGDRDEIIRTLAYLRSAATLRRDHQTTSADVALRAGLALLTGDHLRSREALVARTLLHGASDALAADLARHLAGPDDVAARGLLRAAKLESHPKIIARNAELLRLDALRPHLAHVGATPRGARVAGDVLVAWVRRADGETAVVVEPLPAFGVGVRIAIEARTAVDDLVEETDAGPPLQPVRLRATASIDAIASEARERATWLIGALIVAVCGAVIAFLLADRAVRREAAATRAQAAFLTQVGHDLRTPLANIRLYSETLASGRVQDKGEAREFASIAAREAGRLAGMVDKVLDLGRLDAQSNGGLARCPIDLGELVSEVAAAHRPLLEQAGLRFDVGVAKEPLTVNGNADMLRGALGNLIENALRHAVDGGEVGVIASGDRERIEVRVEDRGPGLPPAIGPRIFERFVRGPGVTTRGTGLGLALVKEVISAHDGQVLATDRKGGGATFTLTFDRIEP